MATKINVAHDFRRGDVFGIDPFDVEVREDLRGRHVPPDPEKVVERAISMYTYGQLQPVEVRRLADNRLLLTMGFTRTAAARLLRTGFDGPDPDKPDATKRYQDEKFLLRVTVADCNDEEAFQRNLIENMDRNDTSPIDDAHNHERLRRLYLWEDQRIAAFYRYKDPGKVTRLRKLLLLDAEKQMLVHNGHLSVDGAIMLLDLDAEAQKEVVQAATRATGRVDGKALRTQVREHHLRDAEPPPPATNGHAATAPDTLKLAATPKAEPKAIARTLADVREFFEAQKVDAEQPAIRKFAGEFLAWIAGKKADKAMQGALGRLLKAEEEDE